MADRTIDLEALALRSGQAASHRPGVSHRIRRCSAASALSSRRTRSRCASTSHGRARGSRCGCAARRSLLGTCARCLGPARLVVEIDAREVEQAGVDPDDELSSPYVDEALLDPEAWLHDALALGIPERLICRPDCAGLCAICGISLNEVTTGTHVHDRPPDPRFAKLRDLQD